MKNFIRRLKGIKTPGAGVDEAQDFGPHIQEMVEGVLEPTISDYSDGWIALTGTPGPVPHGYFYDITEKKKYGYSGHRWSLYQNPYLPNAKKFVETLKKKKGWVDSNPTLRREWYGEWVLDLDALVIKYEAAKNHYEKLPEKAGLWEYIIGADLGLDDADAISVLGWPQHRREVYLIEEFVLPGQTITEFAGELEKRVARYKPLKVVLDTGGLGKKIALEIRKRFKLPVTAAEKDRKFEFIELLNDALRTGTFFAHRESQFAQDASRLKWDQESSKLKIADGFHSDVIDSTLYAFREALHWLSEAPKEPISPGTPAWLAAQEREHEERLIKELQRKKRRQQGGFDDPGDWNGGWEP